MTFDPGNTNLSVPVTIVDDVMVEGNETFSVSISGNSQVSIQPISEAVVEIVDDDSEPPSMSVTFSEESYSVVEGDGSVHVTVQLSRTTDIPLSLFFFTTAGSARGKAAVLHFLTPTTASHTCTCSTANDDFIPTNETLTFSPGSTNLSVSVTIVDDVIREENEVFSVSISGNSQVSIQPLSEAVVEIVDEDSEYTLL